MLRGLLGDDAFFRSLQRYARTNQYRSVITQDLIDAIAEETGRRLEWFFDQWVFKPGHPSFKVGWSWDEGTRTATVTVKQAQDTKNGTPIFRVPLTIDFITGRGRPRAFRVEVTGAEHSFVFPLPAKPDLCRFDPTNAVLKEVDFEKSVGELRLQLRDDDHISGRVFAAGALGKKGGAEAVAALADAVMQDRYWSVQAAAAKALGVVRSEAARDALIACLAVRNPRARRAVIAALGEFRDDRAVHEALLPFARRDRSWFVEAEAHRSIGKVGGEGALATLVAGMERQSFRQIIRQGCIDGFVELRDERGFEQLFAALRYGTPAQSRQFAAGAIGRLGAHFPAKAKELALDLAPYLDDRDFRVRIATARALQALKDPSQAPALDRMAKRELDGRGIRAARDAARALRKGATPPEDLLAVRDDLEKLRGENARLRDRIERLEGRVEPPKPARSSR
jgi:aminopeptidase N